MLTEHCIGTVLREHVDTPPEGVLFGSSSGIVPAEGNINQLCFENCVKDATLSRSTTIRSETLRGKLNLDKVIARAVGNQRVLARESVSYGQIF
jgi:hypothetical protein